MTHALLATGKRTSAERPKAKRKKAERANAFLNADSLHKNGQGIGRSVILWREKTNPN